MMPLEIGLSLSLAAMPSTSINDPDVDALATRMSPAPNAARYQIISDTYIALRAAGVIIDQDVLALIGHENQPSRQNWISNTFNLSAVSSPVFVADNYFGTDGASSHLTMGGYALTLDGTKSLQDDNHFGLWVANSVDSNGVDIGNSSNFIRSLLTNNTSVRGMSGTTDSIANPGSTGIGFYLINRNTSGSFDVYKNGVLLGTITRVSIAPLKLAMVLGAFNNGGTVQNFAARRYRGVTAGRALTQAKITALHTITQQYFTKIGAV